MFNLVKGAWHVEISICLHAMEMFFTLGPDGVRAELLTCIQPGPQRPAPVVDSIPPTLRVPAPTGDSAHGTVTPPPPARRGSRL